MGGPRPPADGLNPQRGGIRWGKAQVRLSMENGVVAVLGRSSLGFDAFPPFFQRRAPFCSGVQIRTGECPEYEPGGLDRFPTPHWIWRVMADHPFLRLPVGGGKTPRPSTSPQYTPDHFKVPASARGRSAGTSQGRAWDFGIFFRVEGRIPNSCEG